MDTIIYVKYKHMAGEKPGLQYTLQNRRVQDFQVMRLEIRETDVTDAFLRRCLPWLAAHRKRRARERLAEKISQEMLPFLDGDGDNACIYDPSMFMAGSGQAAQQSAAHPSPGNVQGQDGIIGLLPFSKFDGYEEYKWIMRLLSYAKRDHFLVLGSTACLPRVLTGLAPRVKSLLWIVPDFTYQNQAESLVEELYQEYGLAVDLRFLPEGATFARLRISDRYLQEPVNVLDFTGEKYLPALKLAPESIWLDFGAMPEKEKRIEGRRLPVRYYSLRTL